VQGAAQAMGSLWITDVRRMIRIRMGRKAQSMKRSRLEAFNQMFGYKPIIGMVHLPPLPGAPFYDDKGISDVIDYAVQEGLKLQKGGVSAIEVENYLDASYFPGTVGPELVAAMSIITHEVRKVVDIPLGVCVLADPVASIAVAHAAKAEFIRATFFTEASVDVSGLVLGRPHEILRYRKFLDPSIKIFADVHIKHSAPLAPRPIEQSAYDMAYFLADGIIISGKHTGFPTNIEDVRVVKEAVADVPILIGSGVNVTTAPELLGIADGAIVGSTLKVEGDAKNPVDPERVRKIIRTVETIRANTRKA
jgi:membrane complex biogenesis BtpA family protein